LRMDEQRKDGGYLKRTEQVSAIEIYKKADSSEKATQNLSFKRR